MLGISIPYFCVVFLTLVFIADMMTSRFLRVYGTHHAKAGSLSIPLDLAYSARSTGCDSFKSFMGIHDSDLSFHCTRSLQPAVVFRSLLFPLLEVTKPSSLETATSGSTSWLMMAFITVRE